MGRLRNANSSNRVAANRMQQTISRKLVDRAEEAQADLQQLKGRQGVTVGEVLDALEKIRLAQPDVDELVYELVASAVLAGATAAEIRAATGIGTATQTRRLPRTLTRLRGHQLREVSDSRHGWRAMDDVSTEP